MEVENDPLEDEFSFAKREVVHFHVTCSSECNKYLEKLYLFSRTPRGSVADPPLAFEYRRCSLPLQRLLLFKGATMSNMFDRPGSTEHPIPGPFKGSIGLSIDIYSPLAAKGCPSRRSWYGPIRFLGRVVDQQLSG